MKTAKQELYKIEAITKNSEYRIFSATGLNWLQIRGAYNSCFKGQGLKFKELRPYFPGDDFRLLDWKSYAKTRAPFVKEYDDERGIEILVFVDCSISMSMGYRGVSKLQMAVEVCGLLYLLAEKAGDRVSSILFSNPIHNMPAFCGHRGLLELYKILQQQGMLAQIKSNGEYTEEYADVIQSDFIPTEDDLSLLDNQIIQRSNNGSGKSGKSGKLGKLNRRKAIVIISDYYNFLSANRMHQLLLMPNVYLVKLIAPLDRKKSYPYLLFGRSIYNACEKKIFCSARSANAGVYPAEIENEKIIKLNIEDNYLKKLIIAFRSRYEYSI
ncbi:MAG: DUF58 domain-containing protein [Oligoflexia bacterium]|nr:DUF58 domain-containing protein [Oligoflexia bacterium]